jgi:hypothetical protein
LRRSAAAAPVAASSGGRATARSACAGNASSSRAWIGRCRADRSIARDRGIRHATSETNSRVVISANHHEPKTSKNPARR